VVDLKKRKLGKVLAGPNKDNQVEVGGPPKKGLGKTSLGEVVPLMGGRTMEMRIVPLVRASLPTWTKKGGMNA